MLFRLPSMRVLSHRSAEVCSSPLVLIHFSWQVNTPSIVRDSSVIFWTLYGSDIVRITTYTDRIRQGFTYSDHLTVTEAHAKISL